MRVTNIQCTLVNTSIEARVTDLEVAQVTTTGAIVTTKSETVARFGVNEVRMGVEEDVRARADEALGKRITTLESTSGTNAGKIETIETTLATMSESAAMLEEAVTATFGASELVSDPVFAYDLDRWPLGSLAYKDDIVEKVTGDPSASWVLKEMPARRALRIRSGSAPDAYQRSVAMPVAPGDVIDMSMAYARAGNGVKPCLRMAFFDQSDEMLQPPYDIVGSGSGAWLFVFRAGIRVPPGAVLAAFSTRSAANGVNDAWVTQLSARLRRAFEYQVSADVDELKYAFTDPDGAIAGIREKIGANWTSLDGRITTNASRIDNRYTKAETDEAISTGITEYNATLTSRFGAKANASTVTALTNRVSDTEDGLEAQSDAITRTQAQTDRASASGLMRVTSSAGATSGSTRIALIAEATASGKAQQAGLYIEAQSDGTNGVYVVADTFAVATSRSTSAARVAPFVIRDGIVRMKDAIVDTLAIKDGSVSTFWGADAYSLTISLSYASDLAIFTSVSIRGTGSGWASTYRLLRNGSQMDTSTFSVSPYTWTFSNAKTVSVAAGTHTIRHE